MRMRWARYRPQPRLLGCTVTLRCLSEARGQRAAFSGMCGLVLTDVG
jgi:hypothetical protein